MYNGELFIREALNSLLEQTFNDFELVVSDNASTDSTEKICREYSNIDNRITYLRLKENIGASANFQYVLKEALGQYFMWAAHDDVLRCDHLANLVTKAEENSSYNVVMSNVILINEKSEITKKISITKSKCIFERICLGSKDHYFIYGLWKTEFLKKLMPLANCRNSDRILIACAASESKFGYEKNFSYLRRVYPVENYKRYKQTDDKLHVMYSSELEAIKSIYFLVIHLFGRRTSLAKKLRKCIGVLLYCLLICYGRIVKLTHILKKANA